MKLKIKSTVILLVAALLTFPSCGGDGNGGGGTSHSAGDMDTFTADSVTFNMVYVPANITFLTGTDDSGMSKITYSYWIGETEVTYELWYTVYRWAVSGAGSATGEGEYSFANTGIPGHDGIAGTEITSQEPVTTINWREAMVWCNALTEWYNAENGTSFSRVYYTDSGFSTPIRSADDTGSVGTAPGDQDNPYVKSDADGFRLLTSDEWELAARYIDDADNDGDITGTGEYYPGSHASGADAAYDVTSGGSDLDGDGDIQYSADVSVYSGSSTAEVKSKTDGSNALGIYDMSGNVWEWCFGWTWIGSSRVIRGGSYDASASIMRIGDSYPNPPNAEDHVLGFRFSRTE